MSASPNIEVEVRVFLTDQDYTRLLAFFQKNAELLLEDEQKTLYLKGKEDLRLQESLHGAKIVFKDGRIHDKSRQETEVEISKEAFQDTVRVFEAIGRPIDIAWHRVRFLFAWKGITVTVDDTRDYEKVLELEKMTVSGEEDAAREELLGLLAELGVEETPADRVERAYASYVERNRVPEGGVVQAGRECVCGKSNTMPVCDGTHSDIEAGDGPKVSFDDWFEDGHEDDLLKNV